MSAIDTSGYSVNRLIAAASGRLRSTRATDQAGKNHAANAAPATDAVGKSELTDEEKQQIEKLRQRDAEVRRHEQAHQAAAGPHATGGPTYEYQQGPDGTRYAVGGEVQIDTSPVRGDPQATIRKMQQVQRAANAPAEPSAQDRQVAAKAAATERQARQQLQTEPNAAEDLHAQPNALHTQPNAPQNLHAQPNASQNLHTQPNVPQELPAQRDLSSPDRAPAIARYRDAIRSAEQPAGRFIDVAA